jgi:hypothetical protein
MTYVDPLRKAFREQQRNAARRGIEWQLDYSDWLRIWQESGHLHERGRGRGLWVMARPGDTGPYAVGNVLILLNEDNVSLGQMMRGRPRREPLPCPPPAPRRWREPKAKQFGDMAMAKQQITVPIDNSIREYLERIAREQDRPIASVVRRLIVAAQHESGGERQAA